MGGRGGRGRGGSNTQLGALGKKHKEGLRARVVHTPNPQEVALKPRPDEIKRDQAR